VGSQLVLISAKDFMDEIHKASNHDHQDDTNIDRTIANLASKIASNVHAVCRTD
jgi:hypothetical protein